MKYIWNKMNYKRGWLTINTRNSFLIMQLIMIPYLFKDIFGTRKQTMQYLLLNNIPHIASSLTIIP